MSMKQEEVDKAIKLYTEGNTAKQIGEFLGVHPETVTRQLRRSGVRVRKGPMSSLTADQIKVMCQLYSAGSSTEEIAVRFDLHNTSVGRYLREAGVAMRPAGFQCGEDHHDWKGGRIVTPDGYVLVLIHSDDPYFCMGQQKADGFRYVLEHRYVMAKKLGRPLRADESVHHKDNNRQNNKPSNLQLRSYRHGKGSAFRCADCGSHNIEPVDIV